MLVKALTAAGIGSGLACLLNRQKRQNHACCLLLKNSLTRVWLKETSLPSLPIKQSVEQTEPIGCGTVSCMAVVMHTVSASQPSHALLFSLCMHAGDMALVTGASGCGKSTLVRALAQLWPLCQGQCHMPVQEKVALCPVTLYT